MTLNRLDKKKGLQLKFVPFFMWVTSKSAFSSGVVLCSLAILWLMSTLFSYFRITS